MLSDNWGEGGKQAQIRGEILEISSSDCDQEERLLWFYLGGWWKHFEIPASTHLWPHALPRVLLNTSPWACARYLLPHGVLFKKSWVVRWRPCMGSLTELWVRDSEWALCYPCNVPSEKLFRKWPGPLAVACGTGMGDSQQSRRDYWTPFWFCALVMGSPNSHHCFPASGGEHTIPRWIHDLGGSLGDGINLNVRGWRICYTWQAFGVNCLTLLVSHLNAILNCFFSCMYIGIRKKSIRLLPW